jgi:hypothetical protein
VTDHPTTLWKLRRESDELACQVRLTPHGIEVDLLSAGRVVVTRAFATDSEALSWAHDKRERRETDGWQAVALATEQGHPPVA